MESLTITKCTKIIKTYYKNRDSATAMYCTLRGDYDLHNRPIMQAIGKILKKFEEPGVSRNIEKPVHHNFAHSSESIAIILKVLPKLRMFGFLIVLRNLYCLMAHYGVVCI